MIIIIRKEIVKDWKNLVEIREFEHKGIKYYLYTLIKRVKGYEIETLEGSINLYMEEK